VASELGQPLGQVEVDRFACGEVYVRLLDSVRGSDAFVVQGHSYPVDEMLMEQLVMIDALKRASVGHVTAVIPYLGYSRQDQKSLEREPISARLVADMLTVAGADRVMVIDLHTGQIQGFFKIPAASARRVSGAMVSGLGFINRIAVSPGWSQARSSETWSMTPSASPSMSRTTIRRAPLSCIARATSAPLASGSQTTTPELITSAAVPVRRAAGRPCSGPRPRP
jgi:ribose-phosphate pyrophosphokinase